MLALEAADPFIMCLSVEELLFIVSPPAYSPGAGLSHTSLYLSHRFSLCLSLASRLYIFDTLPASLTPFIYLASLREQRGHS